MPPKSKKSAPVALKELNPADYVRKPTDMPVVAETVTKATAINGTVLNVESLFPEFNLDGEVWTDPIESVEDSKCPAYLRAKEAIKVKTFLKLEPVEEVVVDTKKGGKAPPKKDAGKKGKDVSVEFQDLVQDENGSTLPRVYVGNGASNPFVSINSFLREWTADQIAAKQESSSEVQDGFQVPQGPEIDRLLCSVYTLIARFAPAVINAIDTRSNQAEKESAQFPFLWNAIYPQSAQGIPCYNPAGKYCVKVFLGGKWRKVVCTDTVYVREDGLPALASSVTALELWPMLLAKAVYAVFTACGYSEIVPDPTEPTRISDDISRSSVMTTSAFVGFALHTLTGWHPGRIWDIIGLVGESPPNSLLTLFDEIRFGGAALILPSDVPQEIPRPSVVFQNSAVTTDIGSIDGSAGEALETIAVQPIMLTKKLFKAEYRRRQQERQVLLEKISLREAMIAKIQRDVDMPYAECFVVSMVDPKTGAPVVLPVLGLCYDPENYDPLDVKILTSWKITGMREDTDTANLYTGDPSFVPTAVMNEGSPGEGAGVCAPDLANVNTPLPSSTMVEFGFISIAALYDQGGMIMGIDTMIRHKYRVALGWHWKPIAAPAEKEPAGKGGKAPPPKKGEPVVVTPVADKISQDAGNMPPTLLAVLPKSEEQLAIEAQEDAANGGVSSARYLSLSVMIWADLVRLASDPLATRPATADPTQTSSTASAKVSASRSGSVVLVLQELSVGGDIADPWIMRLELPEHSVLPMNRITFHIPCPVQEEPSTQPKLFWVRLFSQASVYANICCGSRLALGLAEDIWTKFGYHALVKEGNALVTAPSTEQLMFRIPLQLNNCREGEVSDAMTLLFIEDKAITKSVSMILHSDHPGVNSICLPRLLGNNVQLDDKVRLLVGRCYPASEGELAIPAFRWKLIMLSRNKPFKDPGPVAPGSVVEHRFSGRYTPNKRLILFRDIVTINKSTFPIALRISTKPLEKQKPVSESNSVEKMGDSKATGGKGTKSGKSTPVAPTQDIAAFSVSEAEADMSIYSQDTFGLDLREDIWLVVKLIRRIDRSVVGEYRGRSIIQIYNIPVDEFGPPEPADDKGGKDKKGGAKSTKGAPVGEPIEFILECSLDESAMHIPDAWRSIIPYDFPFSTLNGVIEGVGVIPGVGTGNVELARSVLAPKFQWQVDYLAGSVMGVSHDTYDLLRFLAKKNGWEAESEGRTERAAAALTYYQVFNGINTGSPVRSRAVSPSAEAAQSKKAPPIEQTPQETSSRRDILINQYAFALNKQPAEVSPRIELVETNPAYVEHVELGGEVKLYSSEMIAANRAIRLEEESQNNTQCRNLVDMLQTFNGTLRNELKDRVQHLLETANNNARELANVWAAREQYRQHANRTNESLKYLLERSVEAQSIVAEEEADRLAEASGQKRPAKGKDKAKKK